jgi:hypothetical protein
MPGERDYRVMAMDRTQTLDAYSRAWLQSTSETICACLAECWTSGSTYVNPFTDVICGVEGLARLIMDYPVIFPDAVVTPTREPDEHHAVARLAWLLSSTAPIRVIGRDFGHEMPGMDVVEFDTDNRIRRVTSFFGCPSDRAGHAVAAAT